MIVASALKIEQSQAWPPNYVALFAWRQQQLIGFRNTQHMLMGAKEYYRTHPVEFICDWVDTYDPRNAGQKDKLTRMPFVMFDRQKDMVEFLMALLNGEEDGLVEKCRDAGATWVCVAFSVWLWLFWPGISIGWGSRKEQLVDKLGVVDSIFEKIRLVIRGLPKEFLPKGFDPNKHLAYMRVINPETEATIVGEAGDNIGRGGRTRIYFKDESAHYERPELIEASLGDNTRVQVDISSVNGLGNVFHRKRQAGEEWNGGAAIEGKTNIFIFDWRDHPDKDQDWYDKRKAKAEDDGLVHLFAQEVERNYASSVLGIVIKPEWVEAAIGLAEDFELDVGGKKRAGLDVADDSKSGDKNSWAFVEGLELKDVETWGQVDTGITASRAYSRSIEVGAKEFQYDSIGVGSGVKASLNAMKRDNQIAPGFEVVSWVASGKVQDPWEYVDPPSPDDDNPEGPRNKDFFANFKAQAWWNVRRRFYQAWKCRQGMDFDRDEVVSISRDIDPKVLRELVAELSQPVRKETTAGKMVIDKAPNGARSPNMADSVVIALFPAEAEMFSTEELNT